MEQLRAEVERLERKMTGLQRVREEIIKKQTAELENFGNLGGQQSTSLFGTGQQRSLLHYFGTATKDDQGLPQQLAELTASIEKVRQESHSLEIERSKLMQELSEHRKKLEGLEKAKDALLLQREAAQNTGSTAQISKFYTEEQTRLEVQSAQATQDLVAVQREADTLAKQIKELQTQLAKTTSDLANTQSQASASL